MQIIRYKSGDQIPRLRTQLRDGTDPVPLTVNDTVTAIKRPYHGGEPTFHTMTVLNDPEFPGGVEYEWQAGELTKGLFRIEYHVATQSGLPRTYPTIDYDLLHVRDTLGTVPSPP